jgi:hypothetical protein
MPDGDYDVGFALYDVVERRIIAQASMRCSMCTVDKVRDAVQAAALKIRSDAEAGFPTEPVATPPPTAAPAPTPTASPAPTPAAASGPAPAPVQSSKLKIAKYVTLGLGIATVVVGIPLIAQDGHCVDPSVDPMNPNAANNCPNVLDTMPTGAALLSIGGALLITSTVLFVLDRPKHIPPKTASRF